jgi:chromosome partitioning protein
MKVLAIYAIKGGVGKTAASVNLAWCSANAGYRTLLVDLDAQGSASFYFRVRPNKKFNAEKLIKAKNELYKEIKGSDFENLDILPSSLNHRNIDLELQASKKSQHRLERLLKPLKDDYDVILLDCPPNLTLLSENIFGASDYILTPVIPTTLSERTLEQLIQFFKKEDIPLRKLRPFFSMTQRTKTLHKDVLQRLSSLPKPRFLEKDIPFLAAIENMGETREPVTLTSPSSRASNAYRRLWDEIEQKILDE